MQMFNKSKLFSIIPTEQEPWVALPSEQDFSDWSKDKEIFFNQQLRQTQKWQFYINIFDYLTQVGIVGNYFEFGCHRARTFRMALTEARRHLLETMHFYAFDSFEGMPNSQSKHGIKTWEGGNLSTSEERFLGLISEHGIYTDRCHTIKGFYDHSLSSKLKEDFVGRGVKTNFVCVDCDLYESAVPVFNFIEPMLVNGAVIYIDDYHAGYRGDPTQGVAQAFTEFRNSSKFRFTEFMPCGWWGRSFIVHI